MPNRTIINVGLSGTTLPSILQRLGAYATLLTVSGNSIPASGAVSVTAPYVYSPFIATGGLGIGSSHGTILGIPGTLAWVSSTAGSSLMTATENLTFTRDSGGSAVTIYTPQAAFIPDDLGYENDTVIFWAGRNSLGLQESSGLTSAQQLAAFQANMLQAVAYLKSANRHFLVISESNRNDEYAGSTATVTGAVLNGDASYTLVKQINAWLQQTWPAQYVPVRDVIVASYNTGIPADVTAHGLDTPPPSLLCDYIHYNGAGYAIVAAQVQAALARLGY
jgi:lysophospholipase L1-like esterase